jgi:hypothetical protein
VRARARIAAAIVGATLTTGASSDAVPPGDPDGEEPNVPTGVPNRPPVAAGKAALAGRAELSAHRWSTTLDQYQSSYVRPTSWILNLDGCQSKGGTNAAGYTIGIRAYDWRVEPLDGQAGAPATASSSSCRTRVVLSALGRWRARLSIQTTAGRTLSDEHDYGLRDVVIVAFGDSYVSGEGNPERHRIVDPDHDLYIPAGWSDRQCHRSKASWAMRAAQAFEAPSTTVTFLNYACSGGKVENVLSGSYRGIDPVRGDVRLPAQMTAARSALGSPLSAATRPLHAVLMAVGVNDARFSSVLLDCAAINSGIHLLPVFDDPCNRVGPTRTVQNLVAGLSKSYDRLEVGLSANLRGGAVRFVEYPSRVMTNESDRHGGCGIFEGINSDEAHWITDRGDELNARMAASAAFHGWTYVGGVRDAFRRHGYCADGDRTWFRSFSGSRKLQGNRFGTAHPLWAGHAAIGRLVARTIPPETPAVPARADLRIEFTRVRVDDIRAPGIEPLPAKEPPKVSFGPLWLATRSVPSARGQAIPIGQWVDVPAHDRLFRVSTVGNTIGLVAFTMLPGLKIEDEDAPKGFYTTGNRRLSSFVLHRRADAWRPGTHTLMSHANNATMQVEYRVTVGTR